MFLFILFIINPITSLDSQQFVTHEKYFTIVLHSTDLYFFSKEGGLVSDLG